MSETPTTPEATSPVTETPAAAPVAPVEGSPSEEYTETPSERAAESSTSATPQADEDKESFLKREEERISEIVNEVRERFDHGQKAAVDARESEPSNAETEAEYYARINAVPGIFGDNQNAASIASATPVPSPADVATAGASGNVAGFAPATAVPENQAQAAAVDSQAPGVDQEARVAEGQPDQAVPGVEASGPVATNTTPGGVAAAQATAIDPATGAAQGAPAPEGTIGANTTPGTGVGGSPSLTNDPAVPADVAPATPSSSEAAADKAEVDAKAEEDRKAAEENKSEDKPAV